MNEQRALEAYGVETLREFMLAEACDACGGLDSADCVDSCEDDQ